MGERIPEVSKEFYVERLQEYSEQDARELGLLMPYLSTSFTEEPINERLLRQIVDSPYHEQLVARTTEETRIIGAATLSIIMGAAAGRKGWPEDFVVDPTTGIRGTGQALWNEMGVWCHENDIDLHFTSKATREAAHNFYHKNGARTRETTVFQKDFTGDN